jgi:hypothetical protein
VDLHALRHTFNTALLAVGVPLQHAQALMRHSDPKLTANAYADLDHLPLAENVAKLPTFQTATEQPRGSLVAKAGIDGECSALIGTDKPKG